MRIIKLQSVDSTNRYCEALDPDGVEDFTCVVAHSQTAGRGQRGNVWCSEPGMNLTFSLVLRPSFLRVEHQFMLTEALSLAVGDLLEGVGLGARTAIKWPNDIYVADRKVCGMLNSVHARSGRIQRAVCGIGLNVGQTVFPDWVSNPTSLRLEGVDMAVDDCLHLLLGHIEQRYVQLQAGYKDGAAMPLRQQYESRLYRRGRVCAYEVGGTRVEATLLGVDNLGRLLLKQTGGGLLCCDLKEVRFVL